MTRAPQRRWRVCSRIPLSVCLCVAACSNESTAKLDSLNLPDEARAAVARLRFVPLRVGDRVARGDAILCGPGDRILLAFSRRLMADYLGIDADYLLPELFDGVTDREVLLEVPEQQLMRLYIPPGIGTETHHPAGRVREVSGTPKRSGDLRAIGLLFSAQEIFARAPAAKAPRAAPPTSHTETKAEAPRRLGISAFPRMGPRSGVVIERVLPGSPAERAKLGIGDKIIALNGVAVGDLFELIHALDNSRGAMVVLEVRRKRAKTAELVEVTLGAPRSVP